MSGGWQSQLSRIERWHKRVIAAENVQDREDFLYAFFENSFALRDWLIDTGAVNQQHIEGLLSQHVELRINRDIANSLKHHSIKRSSQEQPPSIVREYTPERPNSDLGNRMVILSEGKQYDAIELATRCLTIWRQFTRNL